MIRCYDVVLFFFLVSLSSLCFATDEDGSAVENFCNTLFKHIGTDISKLMDFFFYICISKYYVISKNFGSQKSFII